MATSRDNLLDQRRRDAGSGRPVVCTTEGEKRKAAGVGREGEGLEREETRSYIARVPGETT